MMSAAAVPDPPAALDVARALAARGWRPFPVEYGGKRPAVGIKWGTATAVEPSDQILRLWFGRDPVNIGIAAKGSGLVILDEDQVGGMERLCSDYGQPVPKTYRVSTNKGWHWYFRAPPGAMISNKPGILADYGFDVRGGAGADGRGDGGYVVAAGSMHESGHIYEAEDPAAEVVELPEWLTQLLLPPEESIPEGKSPPEGTPLSDRRYTLDQAAAWVREHAVKPLRTAPAPEPGKAGGRNNALNNAACVFGHFVPAFWSEAEVTGWLTELAEEVDLDPREIGPTIRSGLRKGMSEPYTKVDSNPFGSGSGGSSTTDETSSWMPLDLAADWDEDVEPETPTLLRRADGPCLIYPGRTHSIYGESESGKSWVALVLAAQVLAEGGEVLYIDHESDKGPIRARLRALGVTAEQAKRFVYVRPDGPRDEGWQALLAGSYTLAVVDGVSVAIATEGASSDSTDETARWLEEVPRALATRTGAAVLTVDHVTKARDGRGRFAIGSQAKLNAISGAAYTARIARPFGRGQVGELILRVTKDRPGGVRPSCGPAGEHGTQEAARLVLDATDPLHIKVEVRRWSEEGDERTDLPFGETVERQTSWREVETPLPDDVVAYQGKGKSALHDLARFMRHAADGGVGQSLADAKRELGAVKNPDGTPRHNRWAIQRAWGALLEDMNPPRLQLVSATGTETGRAVWVRRNGDPE